MNKQLKIGIVTQYYPPNILGGSQISVFNIAKGLSIYDHKVEIFTSKDQKNITNSEKLRYKLKNVEIHKIFDKEYTFGALKTITKEQTMKKQLYTFLKEKNKKFDVLYAYGLDTIPAIVKSKRFADKTAAAVNGSWATSPYYHIDFKGREDLNMTSSHFWFDTFMRIFHKNPVGSGSNKWIKIFFSPIIFMIQRRRLKLLNKIDKIMPLSHKLKKILLNAGFNKNNIFVCHNLFEKIKPNNKFSVYKEYNISKNKKIMLYAGRILKIKGCEIIIRAIQKVIKQDKNVHFLFLGNGSDKNYLQKLVSKLKIEKNVTFGEFLDENRLAKAYKESFVTLYPVLCFDALPRTPTESFTQGTPVIGTTMGGCEELIINNKTGLTVRPENEKDISKSITNLLSDKRQIRKLSKTTIEFSKRFFIKEGIKKQIKAFKN